MSDFKKTIVPRNYHYRIEPNKLYMNINRIFEVEEFTGFSFIEMVIQDYIKYRPLELNKTFEDITSGKIFSAPKRENKKLDRKQYPLTPLLWGRKLNKICKIIEDQKNNLELCDNYGPILYIPINNKLSGIIDKGLVKDYEIYLYLNMYEDIKTFLNENQEEFNNMLNENKLYIKNTFDDNLNINIAYNDEIEIKNIFEAELILEKKIV
jgi:hypothetical protein